MGERPYVSFAEVKEKVTLPEVLDVLGLTGQFTRKGDTLTGVCPLPLHRHGPSPNQAQFKISRRDGRWLWFCFGDCGKGGDIVAFVKAMTGYDDAHVRFWFAEHFGDRLALTKPRSKGKGEIREQAVEKEAACGDRGQGDHPQAAPSANSNLPTRSGELKPLRFELRLDPNVDYLRGRGLTDETIARYGLGLCRKGLLNGYVAIPVLRFPADPDENPVGYLGRWPSNDYDESHDRPRYKWPEGFPKSRVVYGLREALDGTDGEPLVVVEGPFGVYHLAQLGVRSTVCVFGSSLSDEQAAILAGEGRPIVLMFDGDEAGRAGMQTAVEKLADRAFVRIVRLPDGQQPDALTASDLAELLECCSVAV